MNYLSKASLTTVVNDENVMVVGWLVRMRMMIDLLTNFEF